MLLNFTNRRLIGCWDFSRRQSCTFLMENSRQFQCPTLCKGESDPSAPNIQDFLVHKSRTSWSLILQQTLWRVAAICQHNILYRLDFVDCMALHVCTTDHQRTKPGLNMATRMLMRMQVRRVTSASLAKRLHSSWTAEIGWIAWALQFEPLVDDQHKTGF